MSFERQINHRGRCAIALTAFIVLIGAMVPAFGDGSRGEIVKIKKTDMPIVKAQLDGCGSDSACFKTYLEGNAAATKQAYTAGIGRMYGSFRATALESCKSKGEKLYARLGCYQKAASGLSKQADALLANFEKHRHESGGFAKLLAKLKKTPFDAYVAAFCPQDQGKDTQECVYQALANASIDLFESASFMQQAERSYANFAYGNKVCQERLKLAKACDEELFGIKTHGEYESQFIDTKSEITYNGLGSSSNGPSDEAQQTPDAGQPTGTEEITDQADKPGAKNADDGNGKGNSAPKKVVGKPAGEYDDKVRDGDRVGKRQKGSGARTKKNSGSDPLVACHWDTTVIDENDAACRARGTNTEMFETTIKKVFRDTNVYAYLELLRLEAIAIGLQSHRLLTGRDVDLNALPNKCEPFTQDITAFQKTPMPKSKLQDEAFLLGLQTAAKRIQPKIETASDLNVASNMMMCLGNSSAERREKFEKMGLAAFAKEKVDEVKGIREGGAKTGSGCVYSEERRAMAKEAEKLNNEILDEVIQNPLLGVGHDPTDPMYHDMPHVKEIAEAKNAAALKTALTRKGGAVEKSANDQVDVIKKFCKDDTSWKWLIQQPEIVAAVLAKYPELAGLHACAASTFERGADQAGKRIATTLAMGGCIVATLATTAAPPVAAGISLGCAAAFTVVSAYDYVKANAKVKYKYACLQLKVNEAVVCSKEEYLEAAAEYEATLEELVINGVFIGFEAVSFMRAVGVFLKEKDLVHMNKLLKAGKTDEALAYAKKVGAENGYVPTAAAKQGDDAVGIRVSSGKDEAVPPTPLKDPEANVGTTQRKKVTAPSLDRGSTDSLKLLQKDIGAVSTEAKAARQAGKVEEADRLEAIAARADKELDEYVKGCLK